MLTVRNEYDNFQFVAIINYETVIQFYIHLRVRAFKLGHRLMIYDRILNEQYNMPINNFESNQIDI